jgi:hypothetical protein
LAKVPTPPATITHVPIPHIAVVEGFVETLGRRQIGVGRKEFAVSKDGMEMFGVIGLAYLSILPAPPGTDNRNS